MFVDSHAHLDGERFDPDREQVIARAREAGVQAIVAIGNGDGPQDVDCGIRLAEKCTTEDRHKKRVQELFRKIRDNGYIYKGSYTGQYCVSDEALCQ